MINTPVDEYYFMRGELEMRCNHRENISSQAYVDLAIADIKMREYLMSEYGTQALQQNVNN